MKNTEAAGKRNQNHGCVEKQERCQSKSQTTQLDSKGKHGKQNSNLADIGDKCIEAVLKEIELAICIISNAGRR